MPETADQYIQRMLGYVEGQDPLKVQGATAAKLKKLTQRLTPMQLKWKPEPTKWSVAEILAHLADAEIVGSWRMRSIIGADGITVQPFDQDVWATIFQYANRNPAQSLEVFRILRENNLMMLKALPRDAWDRHGMHMERGKETIVHVVRMFAGHDTNHTLQIEGIVAQLNGSKKTKKKASSAPKKKKKKAGRKK